MQILVGIISYPPSGIGLDIFHILLLSGHHILKAINILAMHIIKKSDFIIEKQIARHFV